MKARLVVAAIEMAVARRGGDVAGCILHSRPGQPVPRSEGPSDTGPSSDGRRTCRRTGRAGRTWSAWTSAALTPCAPTTINLRLAAVSGLFSFRSMRDPDAPNPVPKGREAKRLSAGERNGMLAHVSRFPKRRSPLRVRDVPSATRRPSIEHEIVDLLASLRSWRDRAIAGLMLFCGLRVGRGACLPRHRCRHRRSLAARVRQGRKERRVPLDVDVAGVIQTYLLAERPVHGQHPRCSSWPRAPPAGSRSPQPGYGRIFRYHRDITGVRGGASARAAAHVRLCAGRGRRRSRGDAGACSVMPTSTPPLATSISPRPT